MTHILIIDDDEEYCLELMEVMKAEGFQVSAAHDGLSGRTLVEHESYELVILDLKLPALSGYELLRGIRKRQIPLKVLVLSGRPLGETLLEQDSISKDEEEKILKMADAVMSKPFKVDVLLSKVKELTG
jgi:DNA-binding response OmpR family regulator